MTEEAKKPKRFIFVVLDAPAKAFAIPCDEGQRTISPAAIKSVLVALVQHYNPKRNGTLVWPSIPTIAELTGIGKTQVREVLHRLHGQGLIKIRVDSGKSNAYSINEREIREFVDPSHQGRGHEANPSHQGTGSKADPSREGTGTPPTRGGDPSHQGTRIAKGMAKLNSQPDFYPFGGSAPARVSDGDHQRKLAVHGVVAEASERLRIPDQEPPTEEKNRDVARAMVDGALARKPQPP